MRAAGVLGRAAAVEEARAEAMQASGMGLGSGPWVESGPWVGTRVELRLGPGACSRLGLGLGFGDCRRAAMRSLQSVLQSCVLQACVVSLL